MSGTGLIKGLVEEGIRQLIQTEVKAKLNEMFPASGANRNEFDSYRREWKTVIEQHSIAVLKSDPEIQALIKDQIVEFIKGGIAKTQA
jgi:hypothetical protein